MKIISHRGNLSGPSRLENTVPQLISALNEGFYVEIDLWQEKGRLFIGHDRPGEEIYLQDWDKPQIFFHLKTANLPEVKFADFFFMQRDDFSLTARGRIWTNHGQISTTNSVICAPELVGSKLDLPTYVNNNLNAWGICTDFPRVVRESIG